MSASDRLRVLHWNIHSWRDDSGRPNPAAVAHLIQEVKPDVVSLTEVDESWDAPSVLDELAERSGYASLFVPTFEFEHDQARGGFGNALLTRLPISAVRQRQLTWPPSLYDGSEPSEPRSVLLAKLGSMWFGTTHLPREDAAQRLAALERLSTVLRDLPRPWLLCGDFNTPAAAWLAPETSWSVAPHPAVATYPTAAPVEAIDYCLASEEVVLEAQVLGVMGSDHLGVVADVSF